MESIKNDKTFLLENNIEFDDTQNKKEIISYITRIDIGIIFKLKIDQKGDIIKIDKIFVASNCLNYYIQHNNLLDKKDIIKSIKKIISKLDDVFGFCYVCHKELPLNKGEFINCSSIKCIITFEELNVDSYNIIDKIQQHW